MDRFHGAVYGTVGFWLMDRNSVTGKQKKVYSWLCKWLCLLVSLFSTVMSNLFYAYKGNDFASKLQYITVTIVCAAQNFVLYLKICKSNIRFALKVRISWQKFC